MPLFAISQTEINANILYTRTAYDLEGDFNPSGGDLRLSVILERHNALISFAGQFSQYTFDLEDGKGRAKETIYGGEFGFGNMIFDEFGLLLLLNYQRIKGTDQGNFGFGARALAHILENKKTGIKFDMVGGVIYNDNFFSLHLGGGLFIPLSSNQ